jgi:carbon starvation protein CstA
MDDMKCFAHYRTAIATCIACARGMCAECTQRSDEGLCHECGARDRGAAAQMQIQHDARLALRRAGVAVPRMQGDALFVRANGHPLLAGLSLAVCIVVALALGACAALAEQRWGVPRAAIAPALGIMMGTVVTAVLGGTSRLAGIGAALLAALAVAGGGEALSMVTTVSLPGPGEAAAWFQGHHAVALACDALALPLAYLSAAGRRV